MSNPGVFFTSAGYSKDGNPLFKLVHKDGKVFGRAFQIKPIKPKKKVHGIVTKVEN